VQINRLFLRPKRGTCRPKNSTGQRHIRASGPPESFRENVAEFVLELDYVCIARQIHFTPVPVIVRACTPRLSVISTSALFEPT
jgi:hypothetical protein